MRRKLVAGNWKMNGVTDSLGEVAAIAKAASMSRCAPRRR
jgi:triosephosphate isomerase